MRLRRFEDRAPRARRVEARARRRLRVRARRVTLGIAGLGAAWLAGYKMPLASGATYLSVQKLAADGDAERSPARRPRRSTYCSSATTTGPGVGGARGDALHLVGVNPTLHKATMLDIPRDTCWNGDKINAANAEGGGPAQAAAVGGLVGVPVSYVVDVNFDSFQALVDGVGGVTMDVPTVMHDTYSGAYFQPGVQHLNGTAGARVLTRPSRLPVERHHPHRQPGPADPRGDRAAADSRRTTRAGSSTSSALLYQHARALGPRDHGPLPARSRHVPTSR